MTTINKIKLPIQQELKDFEPYFKKSLQSDIPLLATILNFLYRTKGKQLRPIFVFLSSKLHGETNEFSQLAACSVELLHTATLVHDDVVDESYERRGTFSINALWRNKLAVLVGDYILAKGLQLQLEHKKYNFLHLISRAVQDMAEGEILQMKKSRKLDITDDTYFEIIRKKTASLIATSMAIGAASVTDNEETVEKMYRIGQDVGIAFQIKDDIFDFSKSNLIGKPTGNDLKEKKITLPIIYILNNCSESEKKSILKTIRLHNDDNKKIKELIHLVNQKGGVAYAESKMKEFKEKALHILSEFSGNQAYKSMVELVNYTIDRDL